MFEPITVPRKVRPDKLKQTCPFTEELSEYSVKAGREYLSKLRGYLEERFKDALEELKKRQVKLLLTNGETFSHEGGQITLEPLQAVILECV